MFENAFDLAEYEPGRPFGAAGFEVEAGRVPHYTIDAHGFRVSANGTLLAYSGDTGPGDEVRSLAKGADLFLCEATLATPERDGPPRGHLTAEEALSFADGPILLTHRPYELELEGTRLASDGLVVDV
jgi:ribonuclease BN (tRNA processing enzyme)